LVPAAESSAVLACWLAIEFLHVPELRNLSAGGACLELASQLGIPDAFDLIIGEGNVRRPCRVAWRKANRMGVQFG